MATPSASAKNRVPLRSALLVGLVVGSFYGLAWALGPGFLGTALCYGVFGLLCLLAALLWWLRRCRVIGLSPVPRGCVAIWFGAIAGAAAFRLAHMLAVPTADSLASRCLPGALAAIVGLATVNLCWNAMHERHRT